MIKNSRENSRLLFFAQNCVLLILWLNRLTAALDSGSSVGSAHTRKGIIPLTFVRINYVIF